MDPIVISDKRIGGYSELSHFLGLPPNTQAQAK